MGLIGLRASAKHFSISFSLAEAPFATTSESSTLVRPTFRILRTSLSFNHVELVDTIVGPLV